MIEQEGASSALLFRCVFNWFLDRLAEDDPSVDGDHIELDRVAIAVAMLPSCADFVPEGFLGLLCDMPWALLQNSDV